MIRELKMPEESWLKHYLFLGSSALTFFSKTAPATHICWK